jgi:hypothetical protein
MYDYCIYFGLPSKVFDMVRLFGTYDVVIEKSPQLAYRQAGADDLFQTTDGSPWLKKK